MVLGAVVIITVDLITVLGFEEIEDDVEEVEDFDGGRVGQWRQAQGGRGIVLVHGGPVGVDQRAAALRGAVVESG